MLNFSPMMRVSRSSAMALQGACVPTTALLFRPTPYRSLRVLAARQSNEESTRNSNPQQPTFLKRLLQGAAMAVVGAAAFAASFSSYPSTALAEPPAAVRAYAADPAAAAAKPAVMESHQPMPSAQDLTPEELTTVRLFQENTPAVVNISNIIAARTPFSMDVLKLPQGQGSGFIWDQQGHIVTNYHVIRGAAELRVALIDQTVWKARVIGGDPSKDVAVLQLDAPPEVLRNLSPAVLGESSGLFVGQRVLAIGNPFGLDHTLTQGIISGVNRELDTGMGPTLRNVIQTDAAINPGNSGGPLLDSRGRLIGINAAIADPSGKGSSSGVGFAIPIDTVKGLVQQILQYGRVIRPVLGVTIAPPQALRQLNLEGVLILDVAQGSPAAKAGLKGISRDVYGRVLLGDIIVGLNGQPVKKEADLFDQLDRCKVGDKVKVEVLRKGEKRASMTVELAERAPEPSE